MAEVQTSNFSAPEKAIPWKVIWALALLQGANVFGFMAYYYAQPQVLAQFNYSGTFWVTFLIVAQAIIAIVMNPLMGSIVDKHKTKSDKMFNLIGLGVNLAGLVFVVVALGTTQHPDSLFYSVVRPLVPVLVVLWLIAMNIFSSPAMSLLRTFAPEGRIVEANSAFAIVSLGLFMIAPYLPHILDHVPLPAIFLAGGIVLYSAYRLLLSVAPSVEPVEETVSDKLIQNLGLVFAVGFIVNIVTKIPLAATPILVAPSLASLGVDANVLTTIAFIISIAASIPISKSIKRGDGKILAFSLLSGVLLFFLGLYCSYALMGIGIVILLGLTSAFLEVNAVPFVFTRVKGGQSGLGIGSFFSGYAFATFFIFMYFESDVQELLRGLNLIME